MMLMSNLCMLALLMALLMCPAARASDSPKHKVTYLEELKKVQTKKDLKDLSVNGDEQQKLKELKKVQTKKDLSVNGDEQQTLKDVKGDVLQKKDIEKDKNDDLGKVEKELLTTEQAFIASIKELVAAKQLLEKQNLPGGAAFAKMFFSTIEQIVTEHELLLGELTKLKLPSDDEAAVGAIARALTTFASKKEVIEAHSMYAFMNSRVSPNVQMLLDEPGMEKTRKWMTEELPKQLRTKSLGHKNGEPLNMSNLKSLRIMPVQRLPKYPLLLKELQREYKPAKPNTSSDNTPALQTALDAVQRLTTLENEFINTEWQNLRDALLKKAEVSYSNRQLKEELTKALGTVKVKTEKKTGFLGLGGLFTSRGDD